MGPADPTCDVDPAAVLERLLHQRHSCRAFLPRAVPAPTVERMLALAQRAASWCNAQPWQIVVTAPPATDRLRQALYARAAQGEGGSDVPWPREYRGVYLQRRRECGYGLYDSVGIARGDRAGSARQAMENYRLFGAPHLALVTSDEALGPYGVLDCGAWVSQFMLAATSLGVATIAQASLARHSRFLREWFGLGDDRLVVCGVSFGYADTAHPANRFRTTRAALSEAVTWVRE